MAAIRSRISILVMILVVAMLAAVVGYQLAQSTKDGKNSTSINLLAKGGVKGPPGPGPSASPSPTVTPQAQPTTSPPRSCYKNSGNSGPPPRQPDSSNKNCPPDGKPGKNK